jgi:hypothetical protein
MGLALLPFSQLGGPPVGGFVAGWLTLAVTMAAIGYLGFGIRLMLAKVERPVTEMTYWTRDNREHLTWTGTGIALVGLMTMGASWVRSQIPFVFPFWADPLWADIDQVIFGQDPFLPLRDWLGQWIIGIDLVYSMWYPATLLSLSGVFLSKRNVAIIAYFLTWGMFGLVLQICGSAAGPIFWNRIGLGNRFDLVFENVPLGSQMASDYLWAAYISNGNEIGSGITAMPSLHVATAAWIALVYCKSRFALPAIAYYVLVFIGSVALGWHYFMDGLVGTLMALVSFPLARLLCRS